MLGHDQLFRIPPALITRSARDKMKKDEAHMNAGVYLIWSCWSKFSTIEVIMPAAWKAIVLDGYAMSIFSLSLGLVVAGGICAR